MWLGFKKERLYVSDMEGNNGRYYNPADCVPTTNYRVSYAA